MRQVLEAAIELEAFEGDIITMPAVAERIGLENSHRLIESIIDFHVRRGNLSQHPGTEEDGAFTVTPKGRHAANSLRGF